MGIGSRKWIGGLMLGTAALSAPLEAAAQAAAAPPACPGRSAAGVAMRDLGRTAPHLLLDEDFPDPFLARFGRQYHAYGTGVAGRHVQLVRSADLRRWSAPAEVMPASHFPEWIDRNHPQVWAPEVMEIAGRYVLYFNARHRTLTRTETPPEGPRVLQRHCLGAAVADRPEGPFTGVPEPLVCSEFPHGVIDASPYRDGDSLYLYYKDDGNCCGPGSAIWVQGMSPDGLAALGPPTRLVASNDSPGREDNWEWKVVEAPTMVRRGSHYYLFYTGNHFGNRNYSVGYLRCTTPRGPCTDPGENPILWSHLETDLIGPGHQSILDRGGRTYAFFHGWNRDPDRQRDQGPFKRCLYVSQVSWSAGPGGAETAVIAGGEPLVMPPPVD
ncbi:MAG TPA: glycoside hydrolase family 43 protein [Allosphingosinicella sp.]|nr:glycoside hydrolase family 43 protein [Allosphingosinicella sp.]